MKKIFLVSSIIFLLAFSLVLVEARPKWKDPPAPTCPITSDTDIVFYGENRFSAVGDLSESWINHFLSWWDDLSYKSLHLNHR